MQASKALLDWLNQAAPGQAPLPKRFGQLLITSEKKDFGLRHVDDGALARWELKAVESLDHLRRLSVFNPDGEFRPIRFSNDLPRGWVAGPFDVHGLRDALDTVYPVAVALWFRWNAADLRVVSYREAAGRQSGRFKVTASLDTPTVEATIEAVCESCCLRQRLWNISDSARRLAQERFGEFPLLCPEPCAVFFERAREQA